MPIPAGSESQEPAAEPSPVVVRPPPASPRPAALVPIQQPSSPSPSAAAPAALTPPGIGILHIMLHGLSAENITVTSVAQLSYTGLSCIGVSLRSRSDSADAGCRLLWHAAPMTAVLLRALLRSFGAQNARHEGDTVLFGKIGVAFDALVRLGGQGPAVLGPPAASPRPIAAVPAEQPPGIQGPTAQSPPGLISCVHAVASSTSRPHVTEISAWYAS